MAWLGFDIDTAGMLATIVVLCVIASAAYAAPWVAKGDAPLPSWVKSARVLRADEPIFATPSKSGKKRGSAGREARLPVFGARAGQLARDLGRAPAPGAR